jgi:ankyrin repeat protein
LHKDAKITPLLQAVYQLNLQATRRLLDAGAKIEQEKYLIFCAVSVGGETTSQVAMVKLLIQNGADVNEGLSPSYGNSTPLEHTIDSCDFRVTRLLLENGANVDIGSPLHRAVRSKNPASVKALMEYGANPNRGTYFCADYLRNKASPMRLVGKEYVFEMRYVTAIKLAKQMKDSSKEIVEILENTLPLHRNATRA